MKKPELILVELSNGDAAVFLNEWVVCSLDGGDRGTPPASVANCLANALRIDLLSIVMDVPSDDDWNWDDVLEILPPRAEESLWERDDIQFPRLICEFIASQDNLNFKDLAEGMDLDEMELDELFIRAHAAWEKAKEELK